MRLLAHRGWWTTSAEKNLEVAFRRAFDAGFGVETDVRDCAGALVISHDMPTGRELTLDAFLELPGAAARPLAINVKADGMAGNVARALQEAGARDAFVFDMSVPDALSYVQARVPVYARLSEYEPESALLDHAAGVWLDAFHGPWWAPELVGSLLARGKAVCVVSPELHRRAFDALWHSLEPWAAHPGLALCTDHPDSARAFFDGLQPSAR